MWRFWPCPLEASLLLLGKARPKACRVSSSSQQRAAPHKEREPRLLSHFHYTILSLPRDSHLNRSHSTLLPQQWPPSTVRSPHPTSQFPRARHPTDKAPTQSLDLPPVKPSAIALGTIYTHAVSLAVLGPVFGDTYRQAQAANSKEEFFKSKEAATAAASYGSSLLGSAVQAYGVGALLNATGTLSYKGAAYLGGLIFFASSAPSVSFAYIGHLAGLFQWDPIADTVDCSSLPTSSPRSVLSNRLLSAQSPGSWRLLALA